MWTNEANMAHIELIISVFKHNFVFFFYPLWVKGWLQTFLFILNMMHSFSWETGFEIKGDITVFRMASLIMWAVLACCRIFLPVQLRQAYTTDKSTHTMEAQHLRTQMVNSRRRILQTTRPDHLAILQWSSEEPQQKMWSWRPGLSTPICKRETHALVFHTFCTRWDLIYFERNVCYNEMWKACFRSPVQDGECQSLSTCIFFGQEISMTTDCCVINRMRKLMAHWFLL